MSRFTVGPHDFVLDGEPHRILSGAIHYFRVHPEQWRNRIRMAALMGLNTIETYVAWNFHSSAPGQFRTDGDRDLGRFLDIVAEEGLNAIVRPGPYICAEWTNGGLPVWLTAQDAITIRSSIDSRYLAAVAEYLEQVARIVVPRQCDRGGPVILMQVENEYGAYGSDQDYLQWLCDTYRSIGITVSLITVDQPVGDMLSNGSVPGVLATGSFGSQVSERLALLRRQQPDGPLMCAEFWNGWFDSWGLHHHTTSAQEAAANLEQLLSAGASVNIYMFHGGTNFGLTNGANDKGLYQPIVTSYDYDAPLAEDGTPTDKFWAFREVIAGYAPVPEYSPPERVGAPAFNFSFERARALLSECDVADSWTRTGTPATFDELNHEGFIAYRTHVRARDAATLVLDDVRDRAQVFVDRVPVGVLARGEDSVLSLPPGLDGTLEILVEDLGRVNYAQRLGEWKGLGPARVDGAEVADWYTAAVSLDPTVIAQALELRGNPIVETTAIGGPSLLSSTFWLEEPSDLFLDTSIWGKGVAWINGFALGRYWSRGPQRTLYVPGPALRAGVNELIVLELHGISTPRGRFVDAPQLGPSEP
ncbi:MAG: beta-galactosidase [Gordonia sp. (in: high G+C Gram-positive bacteria)]